MITYKQSFLISSILFFIFSINYIVLRENNITLFLASYLDYEFNLSKLTLIFFITVPFISYIFFKSVKNTFAMLLSNLTIVGVLPGIIVYSFSSHSSIWIFFITNIYIVFFLTIFSRKKIILSNISFMKKTNSFSNNINLSFIKIIAFLGCLFYCYLFVKYFDILNFRPMNEIYIQRQLFKETILRWEGYPLLISKTISTFSFLILALYNKNSFYLIPAIFIFFTDYLLGAHKTSIFSIFFILSYFFIFYKFNLQKYYYWLVTIFITFVSIVLNIFLYFSNEFTNRIVALYDRVFFVSIGLFARLYDYVNENGFFYGGVGLFGKIFNITEQDKPSTIILGEHFFNEGVQANVNFIADGYLNFGFIGSFFQILILWIFFNKSDNENFKNHYSIFFPLFFVYSKILTSTGLQIALLSGGMIVFIIYFKIAFYTNKGE
ncbi:O-antigen polymerase [Halarcobacter sp.]|uniref:O-antigen polymerase n=1 Tax=Halarcobacter sp. TaxID=2321133 RepID=UPI002AAA8A40|nr:O-antigen polymerase [Halarcobacter sp.]